MLKTRRLVYFSLFVTLATALGFLEMLLPNPFPLPGVKLGLANLVTLLVLYVYGLKEGLAVSLLRVLFASLLGGTFLSVGFFLSFSGAVLSTLVMAVLIKYVPALSIIGVSMVGAISHNVGQLLTASFLIQTPYLFYYLPVLLLAGLPTGLATGYLARLLLRYLKNYQ
ncbi:MAG: Gx transporter family protein [Clostridia bacterium]|nr:Gx transporter family protein [Clostridia bacterium]MDD4146034.1 Gx transporter family protein [Clostridia bacterium]MDD4665601.1 Gx transporter family protein [Clostridia bacterium]